MMRVMKLNWGNTQSCDIPLDLVAHFKYCGLITTRILKSLLTNDFDHDWSQYCMLIDISLEFVLK